jgi:hypothetical protein
MCLRLSSIFCSCRLMITRALRSPHILAHSSSFCGGRTSTVEILHGSFLEHRAGGWRICPRCFRGKMLGARSTRSTRRPRRACVTAEFCSCLPPPAFATRSCDCLSCSHWPSHLMRLLSVRLAEAQACGKSLAVGIANLLNERELHDLHPPNKKRAAQTRRKGLPPSVLAARP